MLPFLKVLCVELNRALGMALRHVRKFRGMTQEDFEPTSGRPYISKIERGLHSPSVEKVAELCSQLGVTPTTLFSLTFLIAEGCSDPTELLSMLKQELKAIGVPDFR
jgi:transcriptional regulator with XRE-family HTH domain